MVATYLRAPEFNGYIDTYKIIKMGSRNAWVGSSDYSDNWPTSNR